MEDPGENLLEKKENCFKSHWKLILIIASLLIIIIVTVILVLVLRKEEKEEDSPKGDQNYEVLKNDNEFIKPKIKLNAEFKLIKLKNGMIGLLISDPFSTSSTIYLNMPNGSYTETVPGLAHFGEHMVSGGSEKYKNIFPVYNPVIGGIGGSDDNAETLGDTQAYYMSVPSTFLFEETIDLIIDSFRHPLYNEEVVKKEIQAVNSEFYLIKNDFWAIHEGILQQFSSPKTSFNGMSCGNNETLKPEESESLSKKLRGYHMEVKKPDNIFFTLYSSESITNLENLAVKYLNYEMYKFKDNEIDVQDREQLIKNAENIIKYDIFDENLYKHGFFCKSQQKEKYLVVNYNIGKIDYKDIQFDIGDYYYYLFQSQSLYDILKNKNYIIEKIDFEIFTEIENNNIFMFIIHLTDNGYRYMKDVLLIFYKYIEIIKKEGVKKELFNNFIKLKRNQILKQFTKTQIANSDSYFKEIIRNYRKYGVNQIFTYGTPKEENYDESKISLLLNKLDYDKSFFVVNNNDYSSFLSDPVYDLRSQNLKYFGTTIVYGYASLSKEEIENSDIQGLKIREVNKYFSEKYDSVIPCYKQKVNKCNELNEFDYEKEKKYKGTELETKDEHYITYYQIDKSSESYIVQSVLKLSLIQPLSELICNLIMKYLDYKLSEINELGNIMISFVDENIFSINVEGFTDNIQLLFDDLFKIMKTPISAEEMNNIKEMLILDYESITTSLEEETKKLYDQFLKGKKEDEQEEIKEIIESINKFSFNNEIITEKLLGNVKLASFKIAGNIDKTLVESIQNIIENNIPIKNLNIKFESQPKLKIDNSNYIINYYEHNLKSDQINNCIMIIYKFDKKLQDLMELFSQCLQAYGAPYLRFNCSNAYYPSISLNENELEILEQGSYKEISEMEDDINDLIYKVVNKELKIPNYKDILKSLQIEDKEEEKTPDNLFSEFINRESSLKSNEEEIEIPQTFEELVDIISPIFINPKRFTFFVVREGISENDYKETIEKIKRKKYKLNEGITIEHTEDIAYWVNRK